MTKFLCILTVIMATFVFAQNGESEFNKDEFYNVEVFFKDSTKQKYVLKEINFKTYVVTDPDVFNQLLDLNLSKFTNFENVQFEFRDGTKLKLTTDKIHTININSLDSTLHYKYKSVNIMKFDNKFNLESVAKNVLIPIRIEDKLNILGYRVYTKTAFGKELSTFEYYFNNANSNIAISPIDYSNMFNFKMLQKKFAKTIEYVGSDCPEFIAAINSNENALKEFAQVGSDNKELKQQRKEIKEKAKELPKKERQNYIDNEYEKILLLNSFTKIVDKYNEVCTKK